MMSPARLCGSAAFHRVLLAGTSVMVLTAMQPAMAQTTTISSAITATQTIASGTSLSITSTGSIATTASDGVSIPSNVSIGSIWNDGAITVPSGNNGIYGLNNNTITGITNTGTISGGVRGIRWDGGRVGTISNGATGLIQASSYALLLRANVAVTSISNAGTINSNTGYALYLETAGSSVDTITNSGTISGGSGLYTAGGTVGTLTNSGLIRGTATGGTDAAVYFNASVGAVNFTNTGTIVGAIRDQRTSGLTITGGSGSTFGTLMGTTSSTASTIVSQGGVTFAGNTYLADNVTSQAGAGTVTNTGVLMTGRATQITGAYSQSGAAQLVVLVTSGAAYGALTVSSGATLTNGTIVMQAAPSGTLTAGDYTIVSGSVTGTDYTGVSVTATGFTATTATTIVGSTNRLVVTLAAVVTPPPPPPPPPPPSPPPPPPATTTVDTSQPYFTFADPAGSGQTVTFNGGTLQVAQNTTTGQDLVVLATGGVIDTSRNQLVLSGNVTNAGTLQIIGGGEVVSTGTITGGTTTVTNTQLRLNGTLNGALQIGSNATLRGVGTVNGLATIAGRLAPGNSPGTLTFTKPVTLTDTAVLSIDIDGKGTGAGAGNYSRVIVSGAPITVAGALRPVLRGITGAASNSFTPALGDRFNIIHADGGVTGAFSTLDQPASGMAAGTRFDVLYRSSDLDLVVTPAAYGDLAALGLGQTSNQRAAGRALDARRPAAAEIVQAGSVFGALYGLSPQQIGPALDQVAGAVHGESLLAGMAVQRHFSAILDDRLSTLRNGQVGDLQQASRAGLGGVQYASNGERLPASSALAAQDRPVSGVRAWGQVFGLIGEQDSDGNASEAHNRVGGAVAGSDVTLEDGTVLGAALGFGHSELRTKAASQAELDVVNLSLYASASFGSAFVDGQANGGWTQTQSRRRIEFGGLDRTATDTSDGWNGGAAIRAGFVQQAAAYSVEPSIGLRYDHIDRDAVGEAGGGDLALRASATDIDALRSTAMVRIQREMTVGTATVAPRLRLGWAHELGDRYAVSTNSFQSGGAAFLVQSNRLDRDRLLAGFDVSATVSDKVRFYVDYGLELGENSSSNALTAGLRYTW
ncbi:autotransporter outer membrane beta-barrel domain-containing protein [Caulobacter soli]|uniref:autotransporter outer membrane beta-barrel domain-containing protein n=1 Tax=Caulobacter soli TaxID=2708539 RepID=UPI0013EA6D73|nr:autotransporter outer membrane beta-barrel domain-containing protein [Caulobacter soli]